MSNNLVDAVKRVQGSLSGAGHHFSGVYDRWADHYEAEFQDYGYVAPKKVCAAVMAHLMPNDAPLKVLDVGVGTGWLSAQFRNAHGDAHLTGVDVSREMLRECAEKNIMDELRRVDFQAEGLKFDADNFDAVVSSGVFELLPDPESVIREMGKVCKPGGVVCFTTLQPGYYARDIDGTVHSDRSLKRAMAEAGLEVVAYEDFDAYRRHGEDVPYRAYVGQKPMP